MKSSDVFPVFPWLVIYGWLLYLIAQNRFSSPDGRKRQKNKEISQILK